MNIEDYIWISMCALLGLIIHTLVKINSLYKKARASKSEFNYGGYFKDEKISLAISILSIVAMVVVLPELLHLNPKILGLELTLFVRAAFLLWGYCSNDLLVRILGRASDKINKEVEEKLK
jgi:hypothetical protein